MSPERHIADDVAKSLGFRVAYLGIAEGGGLVFRIPGDEKVRLAARERLHEAGYVYGSYRLAGGGSAAGWWKRSAT